MKKNKKINIVGLSQKLGLSVSSVSRALNGYDNISQKTKDKIFKTAKKYNYFPNPVAQRLQKGKTETIGIVLSAEQDYFKDTFFLELLTGISVSLNKIGYDLTIAVAPDV